MIKDPDQIAFIQSLINRPWEKTGLHCWALVCIIQKRLFNRTLPYAAEVECPKRTKRRALISLSAEQYGWREIDKPVNGCVVRMHAIGGNPADLEHAGVYLEFEDGAFVIHTDNPHGVVPDSMVELHMRGWQPRFFIPEGGPDEDYTAALA